MIKAYYHLIKGSNDNDNMALSCHVMSLGSQVHRDPGENERASSWWLAPEPHGSYVANIVSQLDPRCELYIAQIAAYKDEISIQSVVNVGRLLAVFENAA